MYRTLLILSLLLSVPTLGEWDMSPKKDQIVRIDLWGDSAEGIVFQKRVKFGKPVYLVTTFNEKKLGKTKMFNSGTFQTLYEGFGALMKELTSFEAPDTCNRKVAVLKKEEGVEKKADYICLDSVEAGVGKSFSDWYQKIREKF